MEKGTKERLKIKFQGIKTIFIIVRNVFGCVGWLIFIVYLIANGLKFLLK